MVSFVFRGLSSFSVFLSRFLVSGWSFLGVRRLLSPSGFWFFLLLPFPCTLSLPLDHPLTPWHLQLHRQLESKATSLYYSVPSSIWRVRCRVSYLLSVLPPLSIRPHRGLHLCIFHAPILITTRKTYSSQPIYRCLSSLHAENTSSTIPPARATRR
jgi:hypothetical protein